MTYDVFLDRRAQRDLEEILLHLGAESPTLVGQFLDDFEAAIATIASHPLLRSEVRPAVRHESLARFHYHAWYRTFPDLEQAEVFAVLHHRRGEPALMSRL